MFKPLSFKRYSETRMPDHSSCGVIRLDILNVALRLGALNLTTQLDDKPDKDISGFRERRVMLRQYSDQICLQSQL